MFSQNQSDLPSLIKSIISGDQNKIKSQNSLILQLHRKTLQILPLIKEMEQYIVNDNDQVRLTSISLLKTLLERVKSLKLKKETLPLFQFFAGKMVDVVVTKEASFVLWIILENVFVGGRYVVNQEEKTKMLKVLMDLLGNKKFHLPQYEQTVRLNIYKTLLLFTSNQ